MPYRVFRTTYKDRSGRTRKTEALYVEFRDHNGVPRRTKGLDSERATHELGKNLVALADYHRATGGQIDPKLVRWVEGLPSRLKAKLLEWGLLSRERAAAARPLAEHLADFKQALLAKGNTERHATQTHRRAEFIIEQCGFKFYSDIDATRVLSVLHDLRQDTDGRRGISKQTFNFYLGNLKQFCRWMRKNRRASDNPIEHLDRLNTADDRRHDRRALTEDELRRLVAAAEAGPTLSGRYKKRGGGWNMTGPERALLYRLAVETGLRAGEIRSLTRASLHRLAIKPTVTVEAAYSKHRREDTLPLRQSLAERLAEFTRHLAPAAHLFPGMPRREYLTQMLRDDLAAAGIPYKDEHGRFADFHALRHTFITNLAEGGIHPKVAQELARHSTITLTMDRYTKVRKESGQLAEALTVLPDLSCPPTDESEAAQAAGTNGPLDSGPAGADLALCLAQNGASGRTPADSGGRPVRLAAGAESTVLLSGNAELGGKTGPKLAPRTGPQTGRAGGLENR